MKAIRNTQYEPRKAYPYYTYYAPPLLRRLPPGLESITQHELFNLGVNLPRAVSGGVEFEGFLSHLYKINLWSRTASRVLVRIGEFEAKSFAELERKS